MRLTNPLFSLVFAAIAANPLAVLRANSAAFTKQTRAKEKIDPEFAALQGQWERTIKTAKGDEFRTVKEIRGTRETVSVYRKNGDEEKLLSKWHVDFTVKKSDYVRIFTYINMTYTDGPNKGRKVAGPFSYLYQIRGDFLINVTGLLNPDKQRPSLDVYRRVKPAV